MSIAQRKYEETKWRRESLLAAAVFFIFVDIRMFTQSVCYKGGQKRSCRVTEVP